jgi:hypothetical protein
LSDVNATGEILSDASTQRFDERRAAREAQEERTAESDDLMALWWEKQRATGLVRYDPRLLVLHSVEERCGAYGWGTVFYSKAREDYKTRVGSLPEKRAATFDLELMSRLLCARTGGLNVAANPNSIVPGHLVVWPEEKRAELAPTDLLDVSRLARAQSRWTFIHNMERAAASIVDWAHFQAYPWEFPLACAEACETIHESAGFRISRLAETYPAYALAAEAESAERLAAWLYGMLRRAVNAGGGAGRRSLQCRVARRARVAHPALARAIRACGHLRRRVGDGRAVLPAERRQPAAVFTGCPACGGARRVDCGRAGDAHVVRAGGARDGR